MDAGRLVTVQTPKEFLNSNDPLAAAYKEAFGADLKFKC
jgi:hypothetical protein